MLYIFSEAAFASLWFVNFVWWLSYVFGCNVQNFLIFFVRFYFISAVNVDILFIIITL